MTVETIENRRALVALIGISVCSVAAAYVLPALVGSMTTSVGISVSMAGLIAAAEMGGHMIGNSIVTATLDRWSRRRVALVCVVGLLLANFLSGFSDGFTSLLVMRLLAGIGGGGAVGISCATLAAGRNPDRYFGIFTVCALFFGIVGFPLIPVLVDQWGMAGPFLMLAAANLVSVLLLFWFPCVDTFAVGRAQAKDAATSLRQVMTGKTLLAVAAVLAYFTGQGAAWTYVQQLGVAVGIAETDVGVILGVASFAGVIGAGCVSLLNTQFGRRLPLGISIGGAVVCLGVMAQMGASPVSALGFAVPVILFYFATNITVPYVMGVLAALDPSGRITGIGLVAQTAGFTLGPAIAAYLIAQADLFQVFWFGAAGYAVGLILILRATRETSAATGTIKPNLAE